MRGLGFYKVLPIVFIIISNIILAQNPIIRDQFTADPSARVFDGKVYLYPSHDILANEERGRIGWFCMEDYHVFSSDDLKNWTDHGMIIHQNDAAWVDSTSYSMWAPDCIEKDGKYYFYFPALSTDTTLEYRKKIGVAISDTPYGPFTPESEAIEGVHGIDPNPFIDKDGQAYLLWSHRKIFVSKLKENMLELETEPLVIENLFDDDGLIEGPYLFERNGIYYLTYPHVENETERLEYAIADNPMGPYEFKGVIMDESPTSCWTNHHSVIEYEGQWYLFYHHNDLSPQFDKNRSVRIDSLFFNEDGTIQKVIPTLRGVGITDASEEIQIDRYSYISDTGASIDFLDTSYTFKGWKTIFDSEDGWIQYNSVDFGDGELSSVKVNAYSDNGVTLLIKLDKKDNPIITEIEIMSSEEFIISEASLTSFPKGIHNLIIKSKDNNKVEIDWVSFK